MPRTRLGGVKVIEGRAHVCALGSDAGDILGVMCSTMAAEGLNMGFIAHIGAASPGLSATAACARSPESFSEFVMNRSESAGWTPEGIRSPVCRVSIFPHDQRPDVTATLLTSLSTAGVSPFSIGSSPSALTTVVSAEDFDRAMKAFFDLFEFSSCASHREWRDCFRMDEKLLSEVRCSYQQHIITIYGITYLSGLDLLTFSIGPERVDWLAAVFSEMSRAGFNLPFMASISGPARDRIYFSLALAPDRAAMVERDIGGRMPASVCARVGPVSLLFLHGPHFGDRYGIANAFVTAMRNAKIPILALSCAISSISAAIPGGDMNRALEALGSKFQVPPA